MQGGDQVFNWTVVSFSDSKLTLKLNFEDPLTISNSEDSEQDYFIFKVHDANIFRGISGNQTVYLGNQNRLAISRVSKQLKNDTTSQMLLNNAETVKDGMNTVLIIQFIMNMVLSTALNMLLGIFNVLQILCFQTMMNLRYPANAQFLVGKIINILNMEILDPHIVYNLLYDFKSDEDLALKTSTDSSLIHYRILA